jgi:hypothetical protein
VAHQRARRVSLLVIACQVAVAEFAEAVFPPCAPPAVGQELADEVAAVARDVLQLELPALRQEQRGAPPREPELPASP